MSGWTGSASQGFGGKSTFNGDISKWDTGKVTKMSWMFWQATSFNQDIGDWNTAEVTRMNSMFSYASAFNQDIGRWNTAQVTDMGAMFYYASAFNQDISSWTGSAATTAQTSMFSNATAFQAKFKCTDAVTGPASSCVGLSPIPDASWHTFVGECLDESAAIGEDAIGETGECIVWARSQNVWYGTMPNWNVSLVTDMSGYTGSAYQGFSWNSAFNGDISNWDTSQVTNMYAMFWQATSFNRPIGGWDTSKVTNMNSVFSSANAFNQDIGSWDTSQVTDMGHMFSSASAFNHDISSWTGSAATTAQTGMFYDATAFQAKFTCTDAVTGPARSCVLKQSYWSASYCPLGSWVYNNDYTTHETNPGSVGTPEACIELVRTECPTAKIANMGSEGECWCQYHDGSVTEIVATDENNWMACLLTSSPDPIPDASWHTFVDKCLEEAPVTGAPKTGECTAWASGNNYGTMPNWNTSLVEDMSGWTGSAHKGFGGKSTFNADISKWDTGKVSKMNQMFYQASAFNQDIGSWNTAQVTSMISMFYKAYAFNQDIGSWNTAQVTGMDFMFNSASVFNHDISSWTGSAATTAQPWMFSGATAFQAKFTCTDAVTGPANSCACTKCIPNASWHAFVEACLSESGAEGTGECTEWASGNNYGTMPNWDTSLVEDMSGYTGSAYQGFGDKSTFNGDISKWDTGKVTTMYRYVFFRFCVQPSHWELEHRKSD